jgi:hypothetical protein
MARPILPVVLVVGFTFGGCGGGPGVTQAALAAEPAAGGQPSASGGTNDEILVAAATPGSTSRAAVTTEASATGTSPTIAPTAQVSQPLYGSVKRASLGANASLNGAIPFPRDNPWNTDVSQAPVDPNSTLLLSTIGLARGLKPDFGSGTWNGLPIGIPYVVVSGTQARVPVRFVDYPEQSDPGPYPIPFDAPVEGEPTGQSGVGDGDRHVIVVDRDNDVLYETFYSFRNADGSWRASSGAVFRLDSNVVRPTARPGWTSADAAGLPIFPGLVRYDEASTGVIRHALRFTVPATRRAYVPPATHWASASTDPALPPMGMRVRLRASFVIPAGFSTEARAILQALKTYGMLLADNGSAFFVSGAPDPRWNNSRLIAELAQVKGADLEVIRMDGLVTP